MGVMVATHPADRMGLLERELVDRLAHDGTEATRVVVDRRATAIEDR